jgi:hypothetical protein
LGFGLHYFVFGTFVFMVSFLAPIEASSSALADYCGKREHGLLKKPEPFRF